ncbi:RNA-binding protein 34 [Biomphalaria pfeifferi]|uniref:RNA-binding protein 34 n=1 Tax=Biomphalaria pfeifferi TaxID=112525 RepID=A0AAD8FBN3_BIOPF|nr:RNA-binding protein 34 [Biomphalaria pfeifferi]
MATAYKPGMVSGLLFAGNKKKVQETALENLFSNSRNTSSMISKPPLASTDNLTLSVNKKKSLKKKKPNNGTVSESKVVNKESRLISTEPFPYVHETLLKKDDASAQIKKGVKRKLETNDTDKEDDEGKRPRRNRKRDKHADSRTLFIGNCPLTADKKSLRKLFREFGEIETIRFRCAPPADPNLPRRAIVITKNFHERCNNMVAYVVFKEDEAAKKALVRNGYLLDDLHIRVDIAALSKKHDKKRSVFVGNLPFTITEEAIRSHFEDCGEITNVRIVRDRLTSLGKGICYVQFESKDSVSLAMKLNNSELQGRNLRVNVCSSKQKKKEQKEANKSKKPDSDEPKVKKLSFCPSNKSKESFKELLKSKREKRFRKLKKKKENAMKTDGLSSIFGNTAPAASKMKGKNSKGKIQAKKSNKTLNAKRTFKKKVKKHSGAKK